ncbi:hypothetical protein QAD02_002903 [Eretmocerus hayati]|uniref:Uncharacterized protein n=1 Tax=Eretmocerus hayati TaxID=131215 RepID=A0ACC2NMU9_9HYME|nr:hypothetical protein QAD02_002903 [Eretmocerus hayati]
MSETCSTVDDEYAQYVVDLKIIECIQQHCFLYDKSLEEYHKQWRDERPAVLESIAQEISEEFKIKLDGEQKRRLLYKSLLSNRNLLNQKSVQSMFMKDALLYFHIEKNLEARWKVLIKKFEDENRFVEGHRQSGSSAAKRKSPWALYTDMLWLLPFVDHLPQISNDVDSESLSMTYDHPYKRKTNTKKDEEDVRALETVLEQNSTLLKNIEKELSAPQESEAMMNYSPLVAKRHNMLPQPPKFECTSQILTYIQNFKKQDKPQ